MGGNELLESALALAARGFRVFPLWPDTKRPAIKGWPDAATTNPEIITRVWNKAAYNIGVAAGRGLLVLDIDVKNGKEGLASAKALGVSLQGFVVRTPSGGLHVYYRGPDVGNSAGRLGPGLDIRSAGGFVVGPGSTIEGVPYTLEAEDLLAICIQHEIDHLDGKVFVEHLSRLKQDRILKKLKKQHQKNL